MAITTEAGILAGFTNSTYFFKKGALTTTNIPMAFGLSTDGIPNSFASASPGMAGATVDGTTSTLGGTLPFTNPVSGNTYIAKSNIIIPTAAYFIQWFDLLWYNSGITVTTSTAQTVNSVTLPARDMNGSTNGVGVTAWLYCAGITSNGTSSCTISYTNSSGTPGQIGALGINWPTSATAGTFIPFNLVSGDIGVRSIQSITLGTSLGGGTVLLMLIRGLCNIPCPISGAGCTGATYDWADWNFTRLYNGSALSFFGLGTGSTVAQISGDMQFAQG